MTCDVRVIAALYKSKENEAADVDYLCVQLGLNPKTPAVRSTIESFRKQIWNVAAEHGFEAAIGLGPELGDYRW